MQNIVSSCALRSKQDSVLQSKVKHSNKIDSNVVENTLYQMLKHLSPDIRSDYFQHQRLDVVVCYSFNVSITNLKRCCLDLGVEQKSTGKRRVNTGNKTRTLKTTTSHICTR